MVKQKRIISIIIFHLFFIILVFPLYTDDSFLPRLYPTSYIRGLSTETLPLPLVPAISASLLLSGIDQESIEQKQNEIISIIENIKKHVEQKDSDKEKAEEVLRYLHKHIFKRYSVNQTRIDIILKNGSYNCVSSAVLYLLCIKAIGLNVWGIKTKDHAFCRVETGEGDFDVETTNEYGFDPGTQKNFKDKFGNLTGYSYVPPGKYSERTEVNDLELISLILQNRISYLNKTNHYYDAFELAVDLYGLIKNEDTDNILISLIGNMALWYTSRKEYEQGISFYDTIIGVFPEHEDFPQVRYKLVHNYIVYLLDKKKIDYAEQFVIARNENHLFTDEEFKELMIYVILDKANVISKHSYKDAVLLINQSIDLFGHDKKLIKIKDALINNWIAACLDKKEWDNAESLVNEFLKNGEITREQWTKSMSIIYNGRAAIISKEKGNLEAAAYLKEALTLIGEDKILQNNYEYYLYNYTADIHNQVVQLVREKKYTEAIELIKTGLLNVPDSSLLKKDLAKIKKIVENS